MWGRPTSSVCLPPNAIPFWLFLQMSSWIKKWLPFDDTFTLWVRDRKASCINSLILIEVHSETLRIASFSTSLFYVHVVVWIRTAPIGSYIWMLSERHYLRGINKCVLIGESVSLEVFQKPKPEPMSFFSCCLWIWMQNAQLLHQHHVCQHAPMFPPWRQWT